MANVIIANEDMFMNALKDMKDRNEISITEYRKCLVRYKKLKGLE